RCTDCLGSPLLCGSCCRDWHRHLPYHRVEEWKGEYFQPSWLSSLGIEIHLGHGGNICPMNAPFFPDMVQSNADEPAVPTLDSGENPFLAEDDGIDESNWRDRLDEEMLSDQPKRPSHVPKLSGRTMTIIDVSGFHEMTVNFCACQSRKAETVQLLGMGLYPASVVRPSSAFTFKVLDDFTRHNLECKTNAHEYHDTLRRATRPAFPHTVPDRYRELLRCSRQWRHLKTMKWNAFGYGPSHDPQPGEAAIFCPACPQKDVNLPDGWRNEAQDKPWLYARQLNLDGNFKAERMRQKYPEDDVPLTNGSGYLVAEGPYTGYLDVAQDTPQKATCNNHKAQSQANTATKHLAVTGIVAAACARHGCFCPGSSANLQFGERQVNMDYILAQALKLTKVPGVCPTLVLYDIICQYGVYVEQRFSKLPQWLDIGGALDILKGIGLFHVHGHQDSCSPRYSPNYIIGAGQVDGEIIETLWASLNLIAVSCRGMGAGHRTETLDFHMMDSNWRKCLGIVASIIKKYRKACKHVPISAVAFQEIDQISSAVQKKNWLEAYIQAMANRQHNVAAMDIFAPLIKKAASKSDLQQDLARKEGPSGIIRGTSSWLSNGISIQEAQVELAAAVRKMGKKATADQMNQIEDRRRKLDVRIDNFQHAADRFLVQDLLYDNVFDPTIDGLWEDDYDYEAIQAQSDSTNGPVDAEKRLISLPSTLGAAQCLRRGLKKILEQEIELRQGQANDILDQIRISLGHKSFLYRTEIRHNKSQSTITRSWTRVGQVESTVQKNSRLYKQCRKALVRAAAPTNILQRYKELTREDLKVKTGVVDDPSQCGTRQNTLSWFWTMNLAQNANDQEMNDYLDDCKPALSGSVTC
ncbi:hypothetical protein JAAARDRAFT_144073, partial [Jaapia argillacea MUCL 33604]